MNDLTLEQIQELEAAGLCPICEVAQVAESDCICVPCRADVDARSDTVLDPIEHLLSQHSRMEPLSTIDSSLCRCGLLFLGGPGHHRRHVAELVYDALGIEGPVPWEHGDKSETKAWFADDGRLVYDEAADAYALHRMEQAVGGGEG